MFTFTDQAYYRQGVALQCLGRHADALAAFSAGLAQEPKSGQLLSGLMEAAIKSPLKGKNLQISIYLANKVLMLKDKFRQFIQKTSALHMITR